MPGIVELVAAISADVVASLVIANYPPLVDGAILLGRQFQFEQSSPPRIIFIPTKSSFTMKDAATTARVGGYTAEQILQIRNRPIMSDNVTFEIRCWGVDPTNDPGLDFNYTQALYQQVLRTIQNIATGVFEISDGEWTDSKFSSGQLIREGREFVFKATFGTPIQALLEPLLPAPDDVAAGESVYLELPNGDVELGFTNEDD